MNKWPIILIMVVPGTILIGLMWWFNLFLSYKDGWGVKIFYWYYGDRITTIFFVPKNKATKKQRDLLKKLIWIEPLIISIVVVGWVLLGFYL